MLTSRDPHLAGLLEKTLRHVVMLESTCHWFSICFQYIVYRLTAGTVTESGDPALTGTTENVSKLINEARFGTKVIPISGCLNLRV